MSRIFAAALVAGSLVLGPRPAAAWVATLNGEEPGSDFGTAAVVDAAGAVITLGTVNDAGSGSTITVIKADGDGRELWRQRLGGTVFRSGEGGAAAEGIALDAIGDVVVVGTVTNVGTGADVLVAKLAGGTGAELWRVVVDGVEHWEDRPSAVAVDAAGNVVVLGTIASAGRQSDVLVLKLAGASGQQLWRTELAGSAGHSEDAHGLAVDASGHVAVAASLDNLGAGRDFTVARLHSATGAAIWGPVYLGDGNADRAEAVATAPGGDVVAAGTLQGPGGTRDLAVVRLAAATGHEVWRRLVNFGRNDEARLVAVDLAGDVLAAGTMETDSAGRNVVVLKLAGATGGVVGVRTLAGTAGEDDDVAGLAVHGDGSIVVGGSTRNTGTQGDFTVARWLATGDLAWTLTLLRAGRFERANAVATTPAGDVVAVGSLRGVLDDADFHTVMIGAASGTVRWERTIAGSGNESDDSGRAVAVDPSGHVVAAGVTRPASGGGDFTVTSRDGATGTARWERRLSGSVPGGTNEALAVAVDPAGDVVAGGTLENVETHKDFALVKLGRDDGGEHWRVVLSGSSDETVAEGALAAAPTTGGDVVAAGMLGGDAGRRNFFVTRRDGQSGAERWSRVVVGRESGAVKDLANAVTVDRAGNVVAAGAVEVTGPGGQEFAVVKLGGDDGAERWRTLADGAAWRDEARAVVTDRAGDVVAAGWLGVPGDGTALYVVKLGAADGVERWHYRIEPEGPEGSAAAYALAVDAAGDVFVAGARWPLDNLHVFLVVKLSGTHGGELWRRTTGPTLSPARSEAHAVVVDATGDVLAVGRLQLVYGLRGAFLWKLDGASGAERWSRTLLGSANADANLLGVALDAGGNPAVAGELDQAGTSLDLAVAKVSGTTGGEGFCGDGVRGGGERCDDGNSRDGDCCSATCEPAEVAGVCGAPCTVAAECEDGDPCTDGVCDATSHCGQEPVTGDAAVMCAFARVLGGPACTAVPRRIARLYARAGRLVERAVGTGRAARRQRLYRRATAVLRTLGRTVDRAERARRPARRLTPACAATLRAQVVDARSRVERMRA